MFLRQDVIYKLTESESLNVMSIWRKDVKEMRHLRKEMLPEAANMQHLGAIPP